MKVFLLKAGLADNQIQGAVNVIDGLSGDVNRSDMQAGLADSDLFVCDIGQLGGSLANTMQNNFHHILKRIEAGAVLLCFAGPPRDRNYEWLNKMEIRLSPETLVGSDVRFVKRGTIADRFVGAENDFSYRVIFNGQLSSNFELLALNKSNNKIGIYGKRASGHILILPTPKDKDIFLKSFVEKTLPQLGVNFLVRTGSLEPIPEEIKLLEVTGQQKIKEKIQSETEKIEKATQTREIYINDYESLERWKDLLWQTGEPLELVVKDFFEEFFELELRREVTDLVGEYNGREVFIEIKGKSKGIDHKSDFRQIQERKTYDAKDPQNTVALLVGNPFRLNPLAERPPTEDVTLFAKTSVPIAESLGIGLVHTLELYDIVNDFLSNKKINKEKILEGIFNCAGIYKYKQD